MVRCTGKSCEGISEQKNAFIYEQNIKQVVGERERDSSEWSAIKKTHKRKY